MTTVSAYDGRVIRETLKIAFAFVGVIVGAGFASGQEVMQYFVGFGLDGLWAWDFPPWWCARWH